MGGQKASTTIHTMMEAFPNTVYIGATATPIRSDGRDLVEEFFDNNVTSKYCLSEAIRDGLLKKPHYIYSLYTSPLVFSFGTKYITFGFPVMGSASTTSLLKCSI